MKKLLITFIAAALAVFPFSGCGQPQSSQAAPAASTQTGQSLKVVTTLFPPYDFTREITGGKASVKLLLPPGAESHTYEPTPQDIITIQNCDLFIYTGGESDVWIDTVLDSMGEKAPRTLALIDCVDAVAEEIVEGMQHDEDGHDHDHDEDGHLHEEDGHDHDEAHAHDDTGYDEHVWTSPENAAKIVRKISETLSELDTENAAAYAENTGAYITKLDALHAELAQVVADAPRKTLVMGDRFPFRYLADAYGLDYYAAFPGCSSEVEASAATVAFLIDKIKAEHIPAVLYIEFSNHKVADAIAEATGAKTLLLHSVHNLSKEELESGASYLSLMRQNAETLRQALS